MVLLRDRYLYHRAHQTDALHNNRQVIRSLLVCLHQKVESTVMFSTAADLQQTAASSRLTCLQLEAEHNDIQAKSK